MWYRASRIPAVLLLFLLAGCRSSEEGYDMSMEEEIRAYVQTDVRAGFYSDAEIVDAVVEVLNDDYREEAVREAATRILTEERKRLADEQRGWPAITDCDRLDGAFDALEGNGVVARQNFTDCGTCGAAEIWAEIETARNSGWSARGYVFFHQQDTEDAANGYGLCLSYGATEEGEQAALAVANEIVSTLRAHGLPTDWNGTWSKRICVPLKWQRRQDSSPKPQGPAASLE
jgi:hypothetical protein